MNNHPIGCRIGSAGSAECEEEIPITEEMIRAGVEALRLSFDPVDGHMDDYKDTVESVFTAMIRESKTLLDRLWGERPP